MQSNPELKTRDVFVDGVNIDQAGRPPLKRLILSLKEKNNQLTKRDDSMKYVLKITVDAMVQVQRICKNESECAGPRLVKIHSLLEEAFKATGV